MLRYFTVNTNINFTFRCSVDPYLFENFETTNGHYLSAKFRAFKFPESSYVQFHGTVSVCVGKCRGVSQFPSTSYVRTHVCDLEVLFDSSLNSRVFYIELFQNSTDRMQ